MTEHNRRLRRALRSSSRSIKKLFSDFKKLFGQKRQRGSSSTAPRHEVAAEDEEVGDDDDDDSSATH